MKRKESKKEQPAPKERKTYVNIENRKIPMSISATMEQQKAILQNVTENNCQSSSDLIMKLLFNEKFRKNVYKNKSKFIIK